MTGTTFMDPVKEAKKGMQAAFDHFDKEMKNLRTGRASPGMLENLMVEVYGAQMNIKSLGTISVADGRQLVVTLFDPSTADSVAKGIQNSNLGVMPQIDGNVIRVPVPPLSEEVRKDIVKQAKSKVEEAKIAVREARRKGNDASKQAKADGDLTEDQQKRNEKEIQKLTDDFCKQVDTRFSEKEKDILTV